MDKDFVTGSSSGGTDPTGVDRHEDRPGIRRRVAKIAVAALGLVAFVGAGLGGALASHGSDDFDDGWDDGWSASDGSGGSGWDDGWWVASGGSGGSGWDDD